MMNQKTIQLSSPIDHGDRKVTEVTIIKPKPKHLKRYDLNNLKFSDQILLMSDLCNEPPSLIENLELEDFNELGEVLSTWFSESTKRR